MAITVRIINLVAGLVHPLQIIHVRVFNNALILSLPITIQIKVQDQNINVRKDLHLPITDRRTAGLQVLLIQNRHRLKDRHRLIAGLHSVQVQVQQMLRHKEAPQEVLQALADLLSVQAAQVVQEAL